MKHFLQRMMVFGAAVMLSMTANVHAQQLPNPSFEDWSGEKFNGAEQPKDWHASNVSQFGVNVNFAHKEGGHTGSYSMMVQDSEVGVDLGITKITETSPGYFSLGQPWAYLPGLTEVNKATAGTYGGVTWTHKPDTMSVWIKRTGSNWSKEDFYLLYYAWSGTAKGNTYRNKNGGCTDVSGQAFTTNEESDIRLALNGNECNTTQRATQVAEGMWRERAQYGQWTNIRVPIYYMNNTEPTMMNIIFSASNYPNFRANDGLYVGNSLYVDDVELIYASTVQKLYVGGKEWKNFDPNNHDVQIYELDENANSVPAVEAYRGAGALTNARGNTVAFSGRKLSGSEITISNGDLNGTPTVITVKSEDGKSTSTYKILFQKAAGSNAKLASIAVNGTPIAGFAPTKFNYNVDLPYGTTTVPVVTAEKQEDEQTVVINQATSVNGTAKIVVTAANGTTKETYNITFKVGQLADNTLKDILVNGKSIPGFTPTQAIYKVSLPVGTTQMPTVKAVSAYPDGEQTIVYTAPAVIDGGQYQISVTTPGNTVAKVYKLNFKLEASSYKYLADLQVVGEQVARVKPAKANDQTAIDFTPDNMTYYVYLKMGASSMPEIKYTKGDEFQTVQVSEGGLDGTSRITVTAGNGDQAVYKLNFSTEKSNNSKLVNILIGGEPLTGFNPEQTSYSVQLPIGTATLPEIKPVAADEYQQIVVTTAGVNGTTRITVTAGDGTTTIYQITFSVNAYTDNTLKGLYLDGQLIEGFEPQKNEYWVNLPQGTSSLPEVTYELQNANFQTVSVRPINSGLTGDYKITVRPQSGESRTYIIHFTLATSSNTALEMIYIDGTPVDGFDPEVLNYEYRLPEGVSTIPVVTYKKGEDLQRVLSVLENNVQRITVTAESGAKREYTVTFIITVSKNAFLNMIYLGGDSLPGFRSDSLNYKTQLNEGALCPAITVDKAPGQVVTITAPRTVGKATIKVKPEDGASNTYTIEFEAVAAKTARLKDILVDGVSIPDFEPTKMNYTVNYMHSLPEITVEKDYDEQTVKILWKDSVARIQVIDTVGNQAMYSVTCSRQLSANNALEAIYADDLLIDGFKVEEHNYSYELDPGSSYPKLTYKAAENAQVVFFGQVAEGTWGITVIAEDKDASPSTYTVKYTILPYSDATLKALYVDGDTIDGFAPDKFDDYSLILDEGAQLPKITVDAREGQTILIENVDADHQRVVVYAESGAHNTYSIAYTRKQSSNALLDDILIDGVSLAGFDPNNFNYEDSLDRLDENSERIKVVPNVFPIGQLPNQTITTYFSRPNGVTRIHVESQDGTATADYSIAFPVRKSNNNKLAELELISEDVYLTFNPNKTEYTIELPYETTECPALSLKKGEPEQRIDIISRPIGDTTQVIVVAENGDTRSYNILFKRQVRKTKNLLSMIRIAEIDKELSLRDREQRIFNVEMPYGSRSLTVEYEKSYDEQTVFIQPGGIKNPTIIIVKANNDTVADEIYTINPIVPTQNPAVLESITINGVPLAGFDMNKFSYIVPLDIAAVEDPIVMPVGYNGAIATPTIVNHKHYQVVVSKSGMTSTYNLWFYYTRDMVPNADFTNWTKAANNDAPKPTGWNCLADYFTSYSAFASGTHTFGKNGEVTEVTISGSNKGVQLESKKSDGSWTSGVYGGALGGILPAWITLGTIEGSLQEAGGSTFSAQGGITFRNTPDVMSVRAKTGKVNSKGDNTATYHNRIVYQLSGNGSANLEFSTDANTDYREYQFDLAKANRYVTAPTQLNIILNSFFKESMSTLTQGSDASLTVDYLRFSYNHKLSALKVDAIDADKSGNAFSATLTDPERVEIPVLSFTGEVADQAQDVTWAAPTKDGEFETRTATIRNWAENGTDYTDYTLTVKRPLDQRNELADLLLDSVQISSFAGSTTEYTIHIPATSRRLPDIVPVAVSSLQTITALYSEADSTMTITVTPELGDAKTYTVRFVTDRSDDTTLANIVADGLTYEVSQHDYTVKAENMPIITFAKQSDLQTVSLINGVITVTAENGATGVYTIKRVDPTEETTGVIKEFIIDEPLDDFGGAQITKTADQPEDVILFNREFARDSVIFIQSETQMQWQVIGTPGTQTYTWIYSTEKSSNADLATIMIDGVPYENFNVSTLSYTFKSDTTVIIDFVEAEAEQKIETSVSTTEGGVEYTAVVTAEDDEFQKTYTVTVVKPLSSDATLAGILLDGELISGFAPEKKDYRIVLPLPDDGVKRVQPKMPSITYLAGHPGQTITVEPGQLNGAETVLTVKSEDGKIEYYNVLINAEKSHCTDLTGIMVNGNVIDHFEPGRHFYSLSLNTDEVEIDYTADDRFLKVTKSVAIVKDGHEYHYTLLVEAEDGTSATYLVEIYIENRSNDTQLANILLNGKDFVNFERALNPILTFDPGNNNYNISLPAGTTVLPEVSAKLKMDGQSVDIQQFKDSVLLLVTAVDGVTTNTYHLRFSIPLSTNVNLSMIYLNGDSLEGFDPENYLYHVNLPVGVHELPEVVGQKAEVSQTLSEVEWNGLQASIKVQAENPTTRPSTYVIVFNFTQSEVDTLAMIYADGDTLEGFAPRTYYYSHILPVGTTVFPKLEWEKGDDYQDVVLNTVSQTEESLVRAIVVTAENGQKATYTVAYTISKSTVDTLQMIFVDHKPLENFKGNVYEYFYRLSVEEAEALTDTIHVDCTLGDMYQDTTIVYVPETMSGKTLGYKTIITVTAQTGAQHIYTIHYPVDLSMESTLEMIYLNGVEINGFSDLRFNYREEIGMTDAIPVVTVTKKEEAQTVDIRVETDAVRIVVTAEDGTANSEYLITFERLKSAVTTLKEIILTNIHDVRLTSGEFPYRPDYYEYTVDLPYDGTMAAEEQLPTIDYVKNDEEQTVEIVNHLLPNGNIQVDVTVTAPNGEDQAIYSITFHWLKPDDANLVAIILNGDTLNGFDPWITEYTYAHAFGSTETDFFTLDQVAYVLSDSLATATTSIREDGAIFISVIAQSGYENPYIVRQVIAADGDNYLKTIELDGVEIRDFDPEVTFYTYYLREGFNPPLVDALANSENAEVNIGIAAAGDTCEITCTAANKSERIYRIHFAISDIDDGLVANGNDVIIKRVPGANQLFIASLRKAVEFALYDQNGRLVHYEQTVPSANPNDVEVFTDMYDKDVLSDVTNLNSGKLIDIIPGQTYIYGFYTTDKVFKSGKIRCLP